jgi:serine/threonine-protein kinase HipA
MKHLQKGVNHINSDRGILFRFRSKTNRFSRTKQFDEYSEDELSHLAAKAHLPEKLVRDTARETVARFHEHWQNEKTNLPLGATIIEAIENHLKSVPIATVRG